MGEKTLSGPIGTPRCELDSCGIGVWLHRLDKLQLEGYLDNRGHRNAHFLLLRRQQRLQFPFQRYVHGDNDSGLTTLNEILHHLLFRPLLKPQSSEPSVADSGSSRMMRRCDDLRNSNHQSTHWVESASGRVCFQLPCQRIWSVGICSATDGANTSEA